MQRRGGFRMDARNVGGKQVVTEHLLHHHTRLRNVKSDLAALFSRGGEGRKKGRRQSRPKRRAPAVRRDAVVEEAHRRRCEELRSRIERYPDAAQRRKNVHDPMAHPPLLVRYTAEGDRPSLVYANPLRPEQMYTADTLAHAVHILGRANGRPATARSGRARGRSASRAGAARPKSARRGRSAARAAPRPARSRAQARAQAPVSARRRKGGAEGGRGPAPPEGAARDPYARLKDHMFGLVVEHRLYRDEDLEMLFGRARSLNTHLDAERVERAIDELRSELGVVRGHHAASSTSYADDFDDDDDDDDDDGGERGRTFLVAERAGHSEARFEKPRAEGGGVTVSVSVCNVRDGQAVD